MSNHIDSFILQITSSYIVYWNIFLKDTFIWSFSLLWMMIKCCLKNKKSGFQNNLKSQLFNLCCMLHFSRFFDKYVFLVGGETPNRARCENHNRVTNMDICGCVEDIFKFQLSQSMLCNVLEVTNCYFESFYKPMWIFNVSKFDRYVFLVGGETPYRAHCENHNTDTDIDICGCAVGIFKFQLSQSTLCNVFVVTNCYFEYIYKPMWMFHFFFNLTFALPNLHK